MWYSEVFQYINMSLMCNNQISVIGTYITLHIREVFKKLMNKNVYCVKKTTQGFQNVCHENKILF